MGEGTPGRPLRDDADAEEITEEGLEVVVALSFSFLYILCGSSLYFRFDVTAAGAQQRFSR